MTRARRAVLPALLLALVPAAPASAGPSHHGDPVLLALGDSVAAGVRSLPDEAPSGSGYVELVGESLSVSYNPAAGKATPRASTEFEVRNLAASGATTVDLLETEGQVDDAVELIEARQADRDPKNDVEVITLTIGGNDLFEPVLGACLSATPPGTCQAVTSAALAQVGDGVEAALARLTAAAGKHVEVVVTTYYNPIGSCFLAAAEPLARVALEGGSLPGLLVLQGGLNDVIREAAAQTGAQVAELYGALEPGDHVGGADCLHPNAAGHEAIAEQVVATLAR